MHELSIGLSIIEGAQEEADGQGNAHIEAVHLRLGPLAVVVREALMLAYGLAWHRASRLPAGHPGGTDYLLLFGMHCGTHADFRAAHVWSGLRCTGGTAPHRRRARDCRARAGNMITQPGPVEVRRTVLKHNDVAAIELRRRFAAASVYVVSLASSPDSGKTVVLE